VPLKKDLIVKIITKRIPRLGYSTDKDRFFSKLKVGSIFTYSLAYMASEVRTIAKGRGLIAEHLKPGTPEYTKYGSATFKVVEDKFEKEEKIFHFDPQYLDI
jgi:hypothetical protein